MLPKDINPGFAALKLLFFTLVNAWIDAFFLILFDDQRYLTSEFHFLPGIMLSRLPESSFNLKLVTKSSKKLCVFLLCFIPVLVFHRASHELLRVFFFLFCINDATRTT